MSGISPEVIAIGIAFGLVLSLVCYVATNLSPGGMITPPWLAVVVVDRAPRLLMVVVVALVTLGVVIVLRRYLILYGKRLFATTVLLAVFIHAGIFIALHDVAPDLVLATSEHAVAETTTLGFIVPGLLAYQLLRQPALPTLVATISVTSATAVALLAGAAFVGLPTESPLDAAFTGPGVGANLLIALALTLIGLAALVWTVRGLQAPPGGEPHTDAEVDLDWLDAPTSREGR